MKTTCAVDVTYYPYDIQTCYIQFMPWGYTTSEILLSTPSPTIGLDFYNKNGEWLIMTTQASSAADGGFTFATFMLKIERRPAFFVVNVIMPIIFLGALNILVFILPSSSGERISYAITVLLSIAVFMTLVGDNLPKTSEPMAVICYFIMGILVLSTVICCITIFSLQIYHKDDRDPVPRWIGGVVRMSRCWSCRRRNGATQVEPISLINEKSENAAVKKLNFDDHQAFADTDLEDRVTWRMVSRTLDSISLLGCTILLATSTAGFMITASRREDVFGAMT